jgi:hypothetical protein
MNLRSTIDCWFVIIVYFYSFKLHFSYHAWSSFTSKESELIILLLLTCWERIIIPSFMYFCLNSENVIKISSIVWALEFQSPNIIESQESVHKIFNFTYHSNIILSELNSKVAISLDISPPIHVVVIKK